MALSGSRRAVLIDCTPVDPAEHYGARPPDEQLVLRGARAWVQLEVCPDDAARRRAAGQPVPPPVIVLAALDTGAEVTGLDERCVAQLGLEPVGAGLSLGGLKGWTAHVRTYPVRVCFRDAPDVFWDFNSEGLGAFTPPPEAALERGVGLGRELVRVIIGRDILRCCGLIWDGSQGRCVLQVRWPPEPSEGKGSEE